MDYVTREYITSEGERWDTISQKVFGRPDLYPHIFEANRETLLNLKYPATVPAGLKLLLPQLPPQELAQTDEVPPWKK